MQSIVILANRFKYYGLCLKWQFIALFISTFLLAACKTSATLNVEGTLDNGVTSSIEEELPDELMLQVFNELSVKDIAQASQVCKRWQALREDPALWRAVRLRIHGDYPANEATKEQAKLHTLRVHVNTLSDLTTIEHLVSKHKLNEQHPFNELRNTLAGLLVKKALIDDFAAQGNECAIQKKMEGLTSGLDGYEKDEKAASAFNERLIEQGNQQAVIRKINGLAYGSYGYNKDGKAAVELLEHLVQQGNQQAIEEKLRWIKLDIDGLLWTFDRSINEYVRPSQAVYDFINNLVKQGNEAAIISRVKGLRIGSFKYYEEQKRSVILASNEQLIKQGSIKAIEAKIYGLGSGAYLYKRDPAAAVALNESLIEQGQEDAAERKIEGLYKGIYGYKKDPDAAVSLNEMLVTQDNQKAIGRKLRGLLKGEYGYHRNPDQMNKWLEEKLSKGKRWVFYIKSQVRKYKCTIIPVTREEAIEYILAHGIPY